MSLYTWSAAERVEQCPASAVLPKVLTESDDADRGRQGHTFLARRLGGASEQAALEGVHEKLHPTCRGIRLDVITAGLRHVRAEVAYAIDTRDDTVRELGVNIDRAYDAYPVTKSLHVVPGTLDLEGERKFDDVPSVTDWKFGFQDVTPCGENPQLMAEARARQLATDAPWVEARIGYVRPSGYVHFDRARFSRLQLDDWADRQRATIERVGEAQTAMTKRRKLTVHEGDWCRYCPARPACPAMVSLARHMGRKTKGVRERVRAMTPDELGRAWLEAKKMGRLVDEIIDHLKMMAPFPTTPGKEVREVPYDRRVFREERALELLGALGATREQVLGLYDEFVVVQHREVKA